jgi:hypothetical protein
MGLSMPIQPDHVTHISEIIPLKPNSIYLMLKKLLCCGGGDCRRGPQTRGASPPLLAINGNGF